MQRRDFLTTAAAAIAAAAAGLAALTAPAVAATGDDDPVALVREMYRVHALSEERRQPVWFAPHRNRFFTRALAGLFAQDHRRENTRLGFDPLYDAQDYKLSTIDVTLQRRDGNRAVVEARFTNMGKPTLIVFDMVRERGVWRVGDIRSVDARQPWSVVKMLRGQK